MKRYLNILVAVSMAPSFALAQSIEADVDNELNKVVAVQAAAETPVSSSTSIIVVQKQPTTVIEATPLAESKAEQIRRARQDAELATEQRIVEKLEAARMEDEKRRADLLFGTKLTTEPAAPVPAQPVQAQPVQAVVVAAPVVNEAAAAEVAAEKVTAEKAVAPVIIEKVIINQADGQKTEAAKASESAKAEATKEDTRGIIREELNNALRVSEEETFVEPTKDKYVAGILGVGGYADAENVKGNYALGVSIGNKVDNLIIEGSFLYSSYTVEDQGYNNYGYGYGYSPYNNGYNNNNIDVNQYSGSLAAKVQLFDGIVKPVFGGLVAYSYRDFAWSNSYNGDSKVTSHAIDIGAIAGVDFEFNPKYSLGLDFRYMWNLSSRVNVDSNLYVPANSMEIEKLQYYMMSLVGRVNF